MIDEVIRLATGESFATRVLERFVVPLELRQNAPNPLNPAGFRAAWRDAATEQIIVRFEHKHAEPRALLKELISLPFRGRSAQRAARIELAIRGWARRDAMARQAVDDVDARRISYHAQLFSSLGFDIPEARARAFALYAYEVAESILSNQGSATQKAERCALVERLLLMPLAGV